MRARSAIYAARISANAFNSSTSRFEFCPSGITGGARNSTFFVSPLNIAISNTDDHLRNHGFILTDTGWKLSPVYDLNPSVDKDGLALNIDRDNNAPDFNLAKSVGDFFRLDEKQMANIIQQVMNSVSQWEKAADMIGIPRSEKDLMRAAFNLL